MKPKFTAFYGLLFFLITFGVYPQGLMPSPELSLTENNSTSIESFLSDYVQFPSISGHEKEAGEWLKKACKANGLHIKQMGDKDSEYNFTASIYPLSSNLPNIVFLNHIDVVPAGDLTKWKEPPFSGKITTNEIWGRGAFDNKGNAVMQLFSILEIQKKYKNQQLPFNITFLAVSCEETQCRGGAEYVIKHYLDELNPELVIGEGPPAISGALSTRPDQVIFPISVAHKRALWIKLKLKINTSAHGSVTPIRYANKEMVKALNNLLDQRQKAIYTDLNVKMLKEMGKLEKGLTGFAMKHPKLFKMFVTPKLREHPELFALFSNTITLTSLDSENDVVNVIPSEVTALLDCRLLPEANKEEFLEEVKKRLKNDDIEVSTIYTMPEMKSSDDNNIFYKHLKDAIEENYPKGKVITILLPNTSDAGLFRAKGITSFTTVPINIPRKYLDNIHSENERMPRGVLTQGSNTYVDFLENCIEGNIVPPRPKELDSLSALNTNK
ncbi:M20 family metallopeptidase [Galbibacter pacificus]|uniref:M20/M25/M40 family metallo-hydrolase n=1 Tax=Galbibacter pacificus TaxID=2996052 RepID=A0ABT6FV35_9FLAO|nr:M20/M25/M40 family metallo-hydrolase [Galbibacter pacificus]MDG3583395.1 M20/M25/M40 family metallo-hydrolase [Galbibacter pacificus]MDG3587128.1 M20/M25/M40 family metallo-hydrolase [Galbibacter pacificus]